MFGLVGLVVTLGIVMYFFMQVEAPTLQQGKKAQDQVTQISGRGQDGKSAMDSFKIEPKNRGSRLASLLVTDVTPGGAVEDYYGLKKGDEIVSVTTQAGLQKVGDASNDDPGMAKIQVQQAFQGSLPIVVLRNGKQMTLPAPVGAPVTPSVETPAAVGQQSAQTPAPPAPGQTAQPAPQQPQAPRNIYDQVNGISKSLSGQ
jgi:hypothetical protein